MNIRIIAPGRLKEKYLREACGEYEKRLGAFGKVEIIPFEPSRISQNPSEKEISAALESEGNEILKHVIGYVFALCVEGKQISSEELAKKISDAGILGNSYFTFIMGSSFGLCEKVKQKADFRLSFSKMTFPHQLMRVMLEEQIYRAEMIINGRKYHK